MLIIKVFEFISLKSKNHGANLQRKRFLSKFKNLKCLVKSNFSLFTVLCKMWHTPKNEARVTMVSGLGTVDVIILEVSHFDKAILDRGWMVALDLCRKEKKKNDSNTPSITLDRPSYIVYTVYPYALLYSSLTRDNLGCYCKFWK